MSEKIIIFTDGSSTVFKDKNNIKYGGIGVYCPKYTDCNIKSSFKGNVTNQKMELLACIEAIKRIYQYMVNNFECKLWSLVIYTDSMYVINTITEYCPKWILYNWHRCVNKKRHKISNLDLVKELYELSVTLPISYKHVKAHTKQPTKNTEEYDIWYGNKMADLFSKEAMKTIKNNKESLSIYIPNDNELSNSELSDGESSDGESNVN